MRRRRTRIGSLAIVFIVAIVIVLSISRTVPRTSPTGTATARTPLAPSTTPQPLPTPIPIPIPIPIIPATSVPLLATATPQGATATPIPATPETTATVSIIRPTPPTATIALPTVPPSANLARDVQATRARDLPPTNSVTLMVISGADVRLDDMRDEYAASTVKLPIYLTLAHRIRTGEAKVTWETQITVHSEDVVGGTGVLQAMVGTTHTVRETARLMIVESDNVAANLLLGRLGGGQDTSRAHIQAGAAVVTDYLGALGVRGMTVRHGLLDPQAFATGNLNTTTTAALAQLLQITERDRATLDGAADLFALLGERGTHNPWHPGDAVACGLTVARIGGIYPASVDRPGVRLDALLVTTPGSSVRYILAVSAPTTPALEPMIEAQIARFEGDVNLLLTGQWAQCVDTTTRQQSP